VQRFSEHYNIQIDSQQFKNVALSIFNFKDVGALLTGITAWFGGFSAALFSIVFIEFFFLKEQGLARKMLFSLFRDEDQEKLSRITDKTKNLLSRYFIGLIIQITINASLLAIGLKLVDFKEVLFVALFAGMMNIVPYVGPLIGALVGLLVVLLQNLDQDFASQVFPLLVKTAAVFSIAQMLDNMLFQPLIFSNSVKAHPLEIFLVILAAGSLGGLVSMIVAVPLYSLVRIVAKEFIGQVRIVQKLTEDV
jgi:predicted PurR-regulated permease PerM